MALRSIYNYLIEREQVLKMEENKIAIKEIKKLLIYVVTNFALGKNELNRNH